MADAGPLALPVSQAPQAPQPPIQPVQPPVTAEQPVLMQPIQDMLQLNWFHFQPEFSGKPEEDKEAYLLRTNVWMDTHTFPEGVKVQHSRRSISRRS